MAKLELVRLDIIEVMEQAMRTSMKLRHAMKNFSSQKTFHSFSSAKKEEKNINFKMANNSSNKI